MLVGVRYLPHKAWLVARVLLLVFGTLTPESRGEYHIQCRGTHPIVQLGNGQQASSTAGVNPCESFPLWSLCELLVAVATGTPAVGIPTGLVQ